jgi:hypothetical protein
LQSRNGKAWELSSVGSERLPYKQRVGGSTPSAPTQKSSCIHAAAFFVLLHLLCSCTYCALALIVLLHLLCSCTYCTLALIVLLHLLYSCTYCTLALIVLLHFLYPYTRPYPYSKQYLFLSVYRKTAFCAICMDTLWNLLTFRPLLMERVRKNRILCNLYVHALEFSDVPASFDGACTEKSHSARSVWTRCC